MQNYEENNDIINYLGKGSKAKKPIYLNRNESKKYENFNKNYSKEKPKEALKGISINDMLHTVSGKTQAIFKISSYGKTDKKVLKHLSYISRGYRLELEDQDGNKVKSKDEQKALISDWSIDFGSNKRSRDTLHLILSTPPGSNRESTKNAAREFLEKEFKKTGHDYVFVRHDDTEHPHVHCVIKMQSHLGNKLNPRKQYLKEVRKEYAKICRSHGINVEASSRAERGLPGESTESAFVQMRRHHRQPNVDHYLTGKIKKERTVLTSHPSEKKMLTRNQMIRKKYAEKAQELQNKAKSLTNSNNIHQQAAERLNHYAKTMPIEISRGEKYHQYLDKTEGMTKDRQNKGTPEQQALNEYYAVTIGEKDTQGVYRSPADLSEKDLKKAISKQLKNQQQKETGNALELEKS